MLLPRQYKKTTTHLCTMFNHGKETKHLSCSLPFYCKRLHKCLHMLLRGSRNMIFFFFFRQINKRKKTQGNQITNLALTECIPRHSKKHVYVSLLRTFANNKRMINNITGFKFFLLHCYYTLNAFTDTSCYADPRHFLDSLHTFKKAEKKNRRKKNRNPQHVLSPSFQYHCGRQQYNICL